MLRTKPPIVDQVVLSGLLGRTLVLRRDDDVDPAETHDYGFAAVLNADGDLEWGWEGFAAPGMADSEVADAYRELLGRDGTTEELTAFRLHFDRFVGVV